MANITFPTASMMSVDISLTWPGQVVHTSLYTNERQVIERGVGVWQGRIQWDVRARAGQEAEIREIEVFLHRANGAANTFDIPLPVDQSNRFPPATDLRLTASVRAGSEMRLTLNQQTGLLAGDYITIDNMLFQVVNALAGGVLTAAPYRPITIPTAGAPVQWTNPTLRARRVNADNVSNPKDIDWAGPWTLDITGD